MKETERRTAPARRAASRRGRTRRIVGRLGLAGGLVMVAMGCGATEAQQLADAPASDSASDRPVSGRVADERDCEVVTTFMYLGIERIMAAAGEASIVDRQAIDDAYAESRRAVPPRFAGAVAEIEEVHDQMAVQYLDLLAGIRRGERFDRVAMAELFQSSYREIDQIFDRTGFVAACDRLSGRTSSSVTPW